jgi:integrase
MRWEFILWDTAIFRNPKGKTPTARRAIPLMDLGLGDPVAILKRIHIEQGMPAEGWVFPSARAKGGYVVNVNKAFTKARDAAGLPKAMCLYTARHGFGTDAGPALGLKATMDLMGHTQAKTAMIY